MTTLAFLLAIATIALGILAAEGEAWRFARRPTGLLTWFVSGNWPAKVGASLTILGVGALLRYAALHIDVPPVSKLVTGITMIVVLGFSSSAVGKGPARRALSLALSGAAFGVAYLTAYTAFALYGFLDDSWGLALLLVTAIGAGVFAVTRSALSLAVLAMIGAWLAPAFAVDDPGPLVTYGYYVAASALTMVMVAVRGWRPLIHLSFIFTLVGGVFFAWNAQYHAPEHFSAMAPMLLLLTSLHVAMPIVERRHTNGVWGARFDLVYALALPAVAMLFAYAIAPTVSALATLLMCLGSCWVAASLYLWILKRPGAAAHAALGALIVMVGAATRWQALPWALIALAFAVAALALAARHSQSRSLHNALTGLVLVLAALQALAGLEPAVAAAFRNLRFFEQLATAALLVVAARQCRRAQQPLDGVLFHTGLGWGILTIAVEAIRLDLLSMPLVLHWVLLAALFASWAFGSRIRVSASSAVLLAVLIPLTAAVAAMDASLTVAIVSMAVAPLAMIALAVRPREAATGAADRVVATLLVPFPAMIWLQRVCVLTGSSNDYAMLTAGVAAGTIALFALRLAPARCGDCHVPVARMFGVAAALALGAITMLAIGRGFWAISAEAMCLVLLALVAKSEVGEAHASLSRNAAIVGLALALQAHLLRWFGPDGALTIADLAHMRWPTLVSLLWASMGALLTVWSRRRGSRSVWIGGAALLISAAVKLVLVDIGVRLGALGDLTNILAVIAAGGVFLLVGWLAPMPPPSAATESATLPHGGA